MSCHVMSCHVMSCHVMSCHVMSCHVMSCHVMSCHVMSCVTSRHVTSRHVTSRHVTSRHVTSRHVTSRHDVKPTVVPSTSNGFVLDLSESSNQWFCVFYRTVPLGPNQVLLRGAMLRNTKWIFGRHHVTVHPASYQFPI